MSSRFARRTVHAPVSSPRHRPQASCHGNPHDGMLGSRMARFILRCQADRRDGEFCPPSSTSSKRTAMLSPRQSHRNISLHLLGRHRHCDQVTRNIISEKVSLRDRFRHPVHKGHHFNSSKAPSSTTRRNVKCSLRVMLDGSTARGLRWKRSTMR